MTEFTLNGKTIQYDGDPTMPLLWYVRDLAELTGSKFGCGIAMCGACTMHVNGQATRSCSLPMSALDGATVVTIEGLSTAAGEAVKEAWQEHDVVQCGYCQSGQVMQAAALLATNAMPTDEDIDVAMQGNVCRCATYHRIRTAIHAAAKKLEA
ncbi:(2Fe-2S)-binding protein [Marinibactrum halimedae]|uniref:Oxidoreductase subunit alpha n=1 Tax=Marinibactrum halimedae TaxID=1444977 RepID=A0AA37T0W7_9GAMM|nr:(2Fe-2S)-binding protein [Marinibactrum halimedae]MCD9457741.1 (2Fe-2S)-binding protein [Marinibactrum halimedae]GLS24885.1 oxidoreductase subunit alpha [Marinibactrum halimedae]